MAIDVFVQDEQTAVDVFDQTIIIREADGGSENVYLRISDGFLQYSTDNETWKNLSTFQNGTDGKDGSPGQNGSDGVGIASVKQTTTSTADGGNNVFTVTLTNGTSATFTVKNGSKGSAGADGKDGTSVSVKSVSESSADGGANVVTFSDGKTLTVKNGSKGSTGDKGEAGATGQRGTGLLPVTTAPSAYTTAVGGITPKYRLAISTIKTQAGVTEVLLGDTVRYSYYHYPIDYMDASYAYFENRVSIRGATGAAGAAGADGADYVLTEADKSEIVAMVIESLGGNPIFGIVDENNNIIVNGDLPDGTYSVKYEMENGTTVNIGNLVLDTNVYYSITKNLTNCTISNSATQAVQGGSYSATITANSGYELKTVMVMMGGSPVSVIGGKINITNVTGNIVIDAVAEEVQVSYTNLADPTSADWWVDSYLSSSAEQRTGKTGFAVSNFIGPLNVGDVIYIKGIDVTGTVAEYRSAPFKSDKTLHGSYGTGSLSGFSSGATGVITSATFSATGGQFTNNKSDVKYWRIGGKLNGTANDVIITINEPIV